MSARGKFITFEGGEGAGKSTQAQRLKDRLISRGKDVVLTREPGGAPGAEDIRRLLVEGAPERWTPLAETLLFLAARVEHVMQVIEPALAAGRWVVCDRFSDSTVVYQGIARGLGVERVRALQDAMLVDFLPDLTIVLDLDPTTGLARAVARPGGHTRFERFDEDFHHRLRVAFRDLAASEPARCVLVDATRGLGEVTEAVWHAVTERLSP